MNSRTRTALCAALAFVVVTGPAASAFADAGSPAAVTSARATQGAGSLNTTALRQAVAGLPDDDATAAVVRVAGQDGTWRGVGGVHDTETGREAITDGRFRAGSVTKVFTAAVVLQLVAEHRVALDRPVQDYLKGLFPADWPPITVAELLNHTSGIQPADGPGDSFADQYAHRFDSTTPRQLVASALAKPLEFTPGTQQDYLNINYTVLGLLIEKVTGTGYEHQVQRRILDPLHLRDTYFPGDDTRILGPHNHGYQTTAGGLVDVTEWNVSAGWAAGNIISSTADLERFTTALFSGKIVPRAQFRHMLEVPAGITDAVHTMGLSRAVLPDGTVMYGKTGERFGYATGIGAALDDHGRIRRTLVYSVNSTDAKSKQGNARVLPIVGASMS
ncbi:serine hydrolase domain-containing protein [Streptomyces avermitilis]|uniref:serine hydrolase domain-containing protein n=1 Tax=Streptomyces avermitilis TaxID=33903 RepID=UPI0033FA1C26